ncbi:aminotransferase-like domain-containing protein [Brevibacillus daliensis]|uniref:aminotransferase-like domain-containing protein n=1 Tax=Brevibacillus daliensis TaxID=2892995 RepID=UPI001E2D4413|nr:PLP-dependent aminotransferase family protein [Brevibacillus daliensis]
MKKRQISHRFQATASPSPIDIGDWQPLRGSKLPLYRQIAYYMTEKISKGEWPIGYKIPTERALASAFQVNRSTVVTAFQELAAAGLIEGKSGRGTIVVSQPSILSSLDWRSYVDAGLIQPNLPTIQQINRAEFLPDMIRLGTGEPSPEWYPHKQMTQILGSLRDHIHSMGYLEPKGLLELRIQISKHLERIGIQTDPSCILIVSGALQALQLIAIGLLKPGATMLIEQPSYLYSLTLLPSAGIHMQGVAIDGEGIFPDDVREKVRSKVRCTTNTNDHETSMLYTIPCFHNPTGAMMSVGRRQELLQVCQQERLALIEDDVYRELWLDEEPPPPMKAMDEKGVVLYVGSMSKTLSPGLRIGWIVAPPTVVERLADLKMQTDYGASTLSQWAVTEWLSSGLYEQHLDEVRKQLRIRREWMLSLLEENFTDLASWNKPAGGFYIWLQLRKPIPLHKLFEEAKQEGLLLNPGNLYDPADGCHLRLSYAYAGIEEMKQGMGQLALLLKKYLY